MRQYLTPNTLCTKIHKIPKKQLNKHKKWQTNNPNIWTLEKLIFNSGEWCSNKHIPPPPTNQLLSGFTLSAPKAALFSAGILAATTPQSRAVVANLLADILDSGKESVKKISKSWSFLLFKIRSGPVIYWEYVSNSATAHGDSSTWVQTKLMRKGQTVPGLVHGADSTAWGRLLLKF